MIELTFSIIRQLLLLFDPPFESSIII